MKLARTFILLLLCYCDASAQTNYSVNLISKDLLSRASAVIRNSDLQIVVKDLDDVTYNYKSAVTVLNKNGDNHAGLNLWYNKSWQIKSIKGTVYNEFSIPMGKITEKDFKDVSAANDFSLFEDSRAKIFTPAVTTYPYTVVYEYEIHAKYSMAFPKWLPKTAADVSVENASLTFISDPGFSIRYKEINFSGEPVKISKTEKANTYSWNIRYLKASRREPYTLSEEDIFSSVQIAPNRFKYMGVSGSFTNWNEMGAWMNDKLLAGRNIIPETTAASIRELTNNIADPKLKAKKIYEYMQQKTRYISVQVGIGGFQPIKAEDVDKTSYGDCKGLANYTQGLLKVAGINSYYAVINAGDEKHSAIPDFASMDQFNHVILCLPFKNDTTWIDCTSKENPFGYLGNFTDDRLALICTETGGKLIRTPAFTETESMQNRKANFVIDSAGNLSGKILTTFTGNQYDNRRYLINEPLTEQIKKYSENFIDNAIIKEFKLTQDKSTRPVTTEKVTFTARNYATLKDKEVYLPLNMINRHSQPRDIANRINEVYINRGWIDVDDITYIIPKGYKIEFKPSDLKLESPFGMYTTTIVQTGDKISYLRKMQLNKGLYPADSYEKLFNFFQSAAEADDQKIILLSL